MSRTRFIGASSILALIIMMLAGGAGAYTQYSQNKDSTNCRLCHGDFRADGYVSLVDGSSWGDSLHNVHQFMVAGDCNTCHSSGSHFPVVLDSSVGGVGLDPIACAGCHGRMEDGTGQGTQGYSAGLRQHHDNSLVTTCAGCHTDANPANYTPVDENVMPLYFALWLGHDPAHPDIPTNPCNWNSALYEDYAGSTIGLDNDGDLLYDQADTIPCPEPTSYTMLVAGIFALAGLNRRRGR